MWWYLNTIIDAEKSAIVGGSNNTIGSWQSFSFIGGWNLHSINGMYAFIGGWYGHTADFWSSVVWWDDNTATWWLSFVWGGRWNSATWSHATIVGWWNNRAIGDYSFIWGGTENIVNHSSFVWGWQQNIDRGWFSVIAWWRNNQTLWMNASIWWWESNTASGDYATIPGGHQNQAYGVASFAAGKQARALHNNTFVRNDGSLNPFSSTISNMFLINASNGVAINTNQRISWSNAALTINGSINANLPAFNDDADALAGWLAAGDFYQTNGSWSAPLNVPGIVMVKQ